MVSEHLYHFHPRSDPDPTRLYSTPPLDNATLKAIARGEALADATLEWVSWFNHHRLLEPLGYIPPAEAETSYYRHLVSQAATAA